MSGSLHLIVAKDNPSIVLAVESPDTPLSNTSFFFIRRRNHPLFAKYFNKMDLGISLEEIAIQMERNGIDPSVGMRGKGKLIV